MNVLIYALGGGRGHVQRQLALATRLVKLGAERVTLITSSEWCSLGTAFYKSRQTEIGGVSRSQLTGVELISIPKAWSANDLTQFLITLVYRNSWDWLVVDVFPRGILGELEGVLSGGKPGFKTAIVQRIFNENYLNFLNDYCTWPVYDVSFVPGEKSGLNGLSEISIRTNPWIIRSFDEMNASNSADGLIEYGFGKSRKLLLVATGTSEEFSFWRNLYAFISGHPLLANWHIDFTGSPSDGFHSASWPLIDRLPIYELVIGAGGYNLVYECRLLSIPLIAWPLKRKYDDQAARVRMNNIPRVHSKMELVESMLEFNNLNNNNSILNPYDNGADAAADFLFHQY